VTAVSTSVQIDAWSALARLLTDATWPAPPIGTKPMRVFVSTFGKEAIPDESVLLLTETIDDAQSWASIGEARRDESFIVQIDVATMLEHKTWVAAAARIKALVAVVEQLVHSTARTANHPAELAGRLVKWQVLRVSPQVGVQNSGSFFGAAVIEVQVEARIRPSAS
jgi:hypothetical protein